MGDPARPITNGVRDSVGGKRLLPPPPREMVTQGAEGGGGSVTGAGGAARPGEGRGHPAGPEGGGAQLALV